MTLSGCVPASHQPSRPALRTSFAFAGTAQRSPLPPRQWITSATYLAHQAMHGGQWPSTRTDPMVSTKASGSPSRARAGMDPTDVSSTWHSQMLSQPRILPKTAKNLRASAMWQAKSCHLYVKESNIRKRILTCHASAQVNYYPRIWDPTITQRYKLHGCCARG
jgi:hypothetical protein